MHVIRATRVLGLSEIELKSNEVEVIWKEVLRDMGLSPVNMHIALWLWGRFGFKERLTYELPLLK